jgi:hypothetical protein
LTSTEDRATALRKYGWEATLIAIIGCVITALTLVTHLTAHTDPPDRPPAGPTAVFGAPTLQSAPGRVPAASAMQAMQARASRKTATADRPSRGPSKPSDPLEVVIGPNAISGQFILLTADRKPSTPTSDKLTLRLRVVSRAIADLVTPFQSAMLEVRSQGLEPINPEHPFSYPVPAGNS